MRLKQRFVAGLLALVAGLAAGWFWWRSTAVAHGSWGVDAVLTRHASTLGRMGYQYRLSESDVGVLRERDIGRIDGTPEAHGAWSGDVRKQFRELKQRGFKVVAF